VLARDAARLLELARGGGSTFPQLSKAQLHNWLVPAPALPEQTEIETALCSIEEELAAEQDRKSALESLFKTMLHLLMTGQVRVPVPSEAEGNDWPVLPALSAVGGSEVEREVPDDER
jgi:type I restriction enzyme S subunit